MARAHVASWLGDPEPDARGMLSFNPLHHIDPVGTIVVPVMLALIQAPVLGWGKGLPIDGQRMRNPRFDPAVVAVTGPLIYLFMCALAAMGVAALTSGSGAAATTQNVPLVLLLNLMQVTAMLTVFNLLPLPPLNGAYLISALLPRAWAARYEQAGRYGMIVLILLVIILPSISPDLDMIGGILAPIALAIVRFFLWSAGVLG